MRVPKEYGGQGLGVLDETLTMIELRKTYKSMWSFLLHGGRTPMPVMYAGTDYQKEKYLYPFLKGEKRFAFAFTEPG